MVMMRMNNPHLIICCDLNDVFLYFHDEMELLKKVLMTLHI